MICRADNKTFRNSEESGVPQQAMKNLETVEVQKLKQVKTRGAEVLVWILDNELEFQK